MSGGASEAIGYLSHCRDIIPDKAASGKKGLFWLTVHHGKKAQWWEREAAGLAARKQGHS